MSKLHIVAEPGSQNIAVSREFDAPPALVFRAYTDANLVPQWWGPASTTTVVDKLELKPGGHWNYIHRSGDDEYRFFGVYHDVSAPNRVIYTNEFDGMPGHVGLIMTTFEERDGKTILTELSTFPSVEDRDGVIESGMESGMVESFDRLEALLGNLK